MRWIWAAYRKDGLGPLKEVLPPGMDIHTFQQAFSDFLDHEIYVWVCEAPTERGVIPVGLIFGRPFVLQMLIIGSMTWFPWASKRNVYECAVGFVQDMRHKVPMLFHVEQKDKAFAEMIARHGVARRVGTLHDVADEPVALFQSRKP